MKKKIYFLVSIILFIIAVFISLFIFIFSNINSRYSINSISDINIINTNYMPIRDNPYPLFFIDNYEEKIEILKNIFKGKRITARLKYKASLVSHLGEEEIIINGIIPKTDREVFNINLIDKNTNSTIDKIENNNYIIISSATAMSLNINIGDKIILKLIAKCGYYKAEEYIILNIAENLDYNYVLIDINKLLDLVNLNNSASEIYIKDTKLKESYNDTIAEIFGSDFKIYSKLDFKPEKIKSKNITNEKNNIIKIKKKNILDNTFLSDGAIKNIDDMINEIKLYDSESEIKNIINFPASVVTRTGSVQSRVYNFQIDGEDISNYIIEGKIYNDNANNQIIVGIDLANYLKANIGDVVSLIAKGSRGWLETAYFTIVGIYEFKEFKNMNFDIYADTKTISNFIYSKSGDKSPYNESLLIFSEKPIYSDLIKNEIFKDMDIINLNYK